MIIRPSPIILDLIQQHTLLATFWSLVCLILVDYIQEYNDMIAIILSWGCFDVTAVNVTAPEDQEVASVTASLTSTITDNSSVASVDSNGQVPYHILDRSGDSSSIGGDYNSIGKGSLDNKSDTDILLRSKSFTMFSDCL